MKQLYSITRKLLLQVYLAEGDWAHFQGKDHTIFIFTSILIGCWLLEERSNPKMSYFLPLKVDNLLEGISPPGKQTGPICSKLTTSLVNETLKFQWYYMQKPFFAEKE